MKTNEPFAIAGIWAALQSVDKETGNGHLCCCDSDERKKLVHDFTIMIACAADPEKAYDDGSRAM